MSNAIDTIVSGASIVIFLATMIEISSSGSGIALAVKLFNSSLHSRLCSGVRYFNHNDACTATGARRVVLLVVLAMVTQGAGIFVLVSVGVCISGCIR